MIITVTVPDSDSDATDRNHHMMTAGDSMMITAESLSCSQ
jgi:hypothetical protein